MREILTQQCFAGENGCNFMGRKTPRLGKMMTVPSEVAPANLVPAAAVIRGEQALYSQTGRKGFYG